MNGLESTNANPAYLRKYSDAQRLARRKVNRNITSVVRQKVFGIFAFSKRKGDTVFDMTVQLDLVHILRTGKVPNGSKCEWFWRGTRLIGSQKQQLLPPGLQEATTAVPLHATLRRLVDKRDRCTAQYQGKDAFYCNQEFPYRTFLHSDDTTSNVNSDGTNDSDDTTNNVNSDGNNDSDDSTSNDADDNADNVSSVDLSQTSCHGKSYADGLSNVVTGHLRQAAKDGEPVGPGTRGLVVFLAGKMKTPVSGRHS